MWYEMTEYDPAQINGAVLEKAWLVDLCAQLAEMKLTERRKLTGLEPGREDIILAGGLVTLEMMEVFGFSRFTVSDAGLLEGLFLDLCRA
jgi:exopolyphosphatase/guanosine-5'-triphosphate,3'-diphosphate pyrophosphatase